MDQQAIANTLLKDLYEAWASGEWGITLDQLSEKSIWEKIDFSQAVMDLSDKDYIKKLTLDGYYRITTEGVIFVESEGICNQETSQRINSIRCQILNALAEARNQRGSFTEATFDSLVAASDAEAQIVENTLQMLREIKHVTESKSGSYKITQVGNDEIQKWNQGESLKKEFVRISELSPQTRGREFQKLFAKVLEHQGWQQKNVRTSNEEIDIIVYREGQFYLIECEWIKKPVQPKLIYEINGKLSNRPGVQGVAVSMSGFTEGSVKKVLEYTSSQIILLFGPKDAESLIYQTAAFEVLVEKKYKGLVTKKEVIYS